MVKLGLHRLVADLINKPYRCRLPEVRRIETMLGAPKGDLPVLRRENIGYDDLEAYRMARKYGREAALDFMLRMREEKNLRAWSFRPVLAYASPGKAMRYIQRQAAIERTTRWGSRTHYNAGEILGLWKDYLGFCRQLQWDLKNDFVLFPKDIMAAHDDAMGRIKENKKDGLPAIAAMYKELNRLYGWSSKTLLIRPPKDGREIVAEGQKLGHCVARAGYDEKMAQGKTVILFIRQKAAPKKPFYTLEYKDGTVEQCYGRQNRSMTEEVRRFVEAWKKVIAGRELQKYRMA